jgi:hypothetical protein
MQTSWRQLSALLTVLALTAEVPAAKAVCLIT